MKSRSNASDPYTFNRHDTRHVFNDFNVCIWLWGINGWWYHAFSSWIYTYIHTHAHTHAQHNYCHFHYAETLLSPAIRGHSLTMTHFGGAFFYGFHLCLAFLLIVIRLRFNPLYCVTGVCVSGIQYTIEIHAYGRKCRLMNSTVVHLFAILDTQICLKYSFYYRWTTTNYTN